MVAKKQFYSNDDVQEMIRDVTGDKMAMNYVINDISSASDKRAIEFVLGTGSVEDFDRFDSDVCEQFIRAYERWVGVNKWVNEFL